MLGDGQRTEGSGAGEEKEGGLTDSSCSPGGSHDEEDDEDDREAARDDVGDIAQRTLLACTEDAAFWVHANGSGNRVGRDALED